MIRFFKWIMMASLTAGLLGVALAIIGYFILSRTVPPGDYKASLPGLQDQARITFDQHGIPHIRASSFEDGVRTMGYVHAKDRLWQMEFLRRAGQGRLSEVFGEKAISADIFLQTLGIADSARASFNKLLPETRKLLMAYAEGVNAWADRQTRIFEPANGVEFLLTGRSPEPWEGWHSVMLLKVMGLTLGTNMDREIQRLALASRGFNPREIADIMFESPRDNPPVLPDLRKLYDFSGTTLSSIDVSGGQTDDADMFDWPTGQFASNNWVVSGERTASGKPVLANDPHLGLATPAVFYLAHLSFPHEQEERHMVGAMLPGIPFLILGRNDRIAWGLTSTGLDSQDLFVEKVNPDNPSEYLTENGWREFAKEELRIVVSDGEERLIERRTSRHGPVLPASFRNIGRYLPPGHVASLKWTGLSEDDTTLDTLMRSSLAKDVADFLLSARYAVSPMNSAVVADTKGSIALVAPGKIPKRNPENLIAGRAPVPGWMPKYGWDGYLDTSEAPRIVNPESGAIATANANFLPENYANLITYDWAEHFRQARVEMLVVENKGVHDISYSQQVMADDHSEAMLSLRDFALQTMPAGVGRLSSVLSALRAWDGNMQSDRAEPLIMLAWFRHLHIRLLKDDLGSAYSLFERGRLTPLLNILRRSGARDWCDDKNSPEDESCARILELALSDAVSELTGTYGPDLRNWNYGDAHLAFGEHKPFGAVDFLAGYFNILLPSGGGPYTLHRGQTDFSKDNPYRNRHAAGYRAIYDFSDLDRSLFVISTGQSGHVLSPHYDDLANKWMKSEFITIPTAEKDYRAGASGTWHLTP